MIIIKRLKRLWFLPITILVISCSGVGIPEDKIDYIGEWRGYGIELDISSDGYVDYRSTVGVAEKNYFCTNH